MATSPNKTIHLDGRMLEGGGQLVRNAVALAALTGRPITVTNIRGNRQGKTGLKGSHAAAISFIAELCHGEVVGGEVGSKTLTFYPRGGPRVKEDETEPRSSKVTAPAFINLTLANRELPNIKPEYTVHQATAGSIALIFQAVYPYLVYASSLARLSKEPVRLNITGGTNVTCAPSIDYLHQVLAPNLRKFGLPELVINLKKRGWSTGPPDLGAVTFHIHPFDSNSFSEQHSTMSMFPILNLGQYQRAPIIKVDITVLAPDTGLQEQQVQENRKDKRKPGRSVGSRFGNGDALDGTVAPGMTVREYLEGKTERGLRRAMNQLPKDAIARQSTKTVDDGEILPINLYTSEATYHPTHLYVLLVAHMSNGLSVGADSLFDGFGSRERKSHAGKHRGGRAENSMISTLEDLVDKCIDSLMEELRGNLGGSTGQTKHQPCVDVHMRDQLVIFDALGSVEISGRNKPEPRPGVIGEEDERYWSSHTRTARWVCEQILGENI